MSKTMSWPARAVYVFIALALALSMAGITAISNTVDADPGTTKWTKVSTPRMDYTDWKIYKDSSIYNFDMGPDGKTIYAVGEVHSGDDEGIYLWKSTDYGASWSDKKSAIQKGATTKADGLPKVFASFNLVSAAPEDADFIAVAGYLDDGSPAVVFSDNGGGKFHYLGAIDAGEIYSMDVSMDVDDNHFVMVGTDEGIFIIEGSQLWRLARGQRQSWLAGRPGCGNNSGFLATIR